MGYVLFYCGVSHFLGSAKHRAELLAFYFSCFALCLIVYPSMFLLYECGSKSDADLIVKLIGTQ